MSHSLPHNLANGTNPDASQVQGNDDKLLEIVNGIMGVGASTSNNGAKRTAVGSSTTVVTSSDATFTVQVPSLLIMSYSGHVHFGIENVGDFSCSLGPVLDGTPIGGFSAHSEKRDSGHEGEPEVKTEPLSGAAKISLTAGTHTLALRYITTITVLGGIEMTVEGVQGVGASWSGIIVPVQP